MNTKKRCELYLLSKPTFQNAALADFLNHTTPHSCRVVEQIPAKLEERNALLLVDTYERDPLDTLCWLESFGGLTGSAQVGLMNVLLADCPVAALGFPFLRGIFAMGADHAQLVRGIDAILDGEGWLPRRLLLAHLERTRRRTPARYTVFSSLTGKEVEILTLLSAGNTNTDIAEHLKISVHTVKTHVYNLFRKIKVNNRTQATNWANQHLEHLKFLTSSPESYGRFH